MLSRVLEHLVVDLSCAWDTEVPEGKLDKPSESQVTRALMELSERGSFKIGHHLYTKQNAGKA